MLFSSKMDACQFIMSEDIEHNIDTAHMFGWLLRKKEYSVKEISSILNAVINAQHYNQEQMSELIGNLVKNRPNRFLVLEHSKEYVLN